MILITADLGQVKIYFAEQCDLGPCLFVGIEKEIIIGWEECAPMCTSVRGFDNQI